MKMFRMMLAMLGLSLMIATGAQARKAGAGARAGLPDLFAELGLGKDATGDDIAQGITDKLGQAFLNKDRNKVRKLKGMLQVFLQRRPFWQNLDLDRDDRNDAEALAQSYVEAFTEVVSLGRQANRISRDSNDPRAIATKKALNTVNAISARELRRQAGEWVAKNPTRKAAFLEQAGAGSLEDLNIRIEKGTDEEERVPNYFTDDEQDYEFDLDEEYNEDELNF